MDTFILIDSDEGLTQHIKKALSSPSLQCIVASDANEGFLAIKQHRPQVVVLCVELPGTSGYSLCNKLKKDVDCAAIPLVLTSSQATPETFLQHQKLKTRAEAYLHKPYSLDALRECLSPWLRFTEHGSAKESSKKQVHESHLNKSSQGEEHSQLFDVTPPPHLHTQHQAVGVEQRLVEPIDDILETHVVSSQRLRDIAPVAPVPAMGSAAKKAASSPSSIGMDELDELLGLKGGAPSTQVRQVAKVQEAHASTFDDLHAAASSHQQDDVEQAAIPKAQVPRVGRTTHRSEYTDSKRLQQLDVDVSDLGAVPHRHAESRAPISTPVQDPLPSQRTAPVDGIGGVDLGKSENNRALRLKIQQLEAKLAENELAFHDRLLEETSKGREVVELKTRVAQLEKNYQQSQLAKQQLEETLMRHQEENDALMQQLEQRSAAHDGLADKLRQLVDKYNQLAAHHEALTQALQERDKELEQWQTGAGSRQQVRDKVRKAISIAQQLLQEMQGTSSS